MRGLCGARGSGDGAVSGRRVHLKAGEHSELSPVVSGPEEKSCLRGKGGGGGGGQRVSAIMRPSSKHDLTWNEAAY